MPGFLKFSIGDITQAAVFAALIVVLGLPGSFNLASGVPITLQTMGVMLAGAVLGPRKGTLAVVLFMVLALAGLPILAGGRTGTMAIASPTAGYFLGFLPGVIVIGLLTALMMPRYRIWLGIVVNLVGGVLVIYLCGIAGLMLRGGVPFVTAITTNGPFVLGDVIKAVLTALIAAAVHRGRPGLITPIRR
ncbi:biotin transporter BioY [Gordonia sp. (in: high G+C Gram-positive bacteria)]|uniref:biotin transporter BioY n=1 Tax=unclassified Gordonia (in: high G+C Gram-positive bacteria) TaxID=2657482 RepID=UPI0026214117|nr:biotin transporter BioY [Gordonia sp. (in: high G+C Gram-positive bacteria)]